MNDVFQPFVRLQSKCVFGQELIGYLGHIILAKGVVVDPGKIQAITYWPLPMTVKGVRSFLGLSRYYCRFIYNYAMVAEPLTDLLKKDSFHWYIQASLAFSNLQTLLAPALILQLSDFSKPFTLEIDASKVGIGAVLSQDRYPIAFFNQKLSPHLQLASTY
ncbi:reverse transcriptase [Gossypium australe]|uniref:Reverse transcriptase n=1 Tax=Gossypium australe TaxID=47621 RepID=A0A5B6UEP3_9ROSI|nr:reverse transcriptase [Gossypium australe]